MKLLISGFEPFGEDRINSSWEAVKELPDKIGNIDIIRIQLPVSGTSSLAILHEAILLHNPDVILNVGQAKGRTAISVERIGINIDDFRIADNDGNQFHETAIYRDGPDAYFSNLPITIMGQYINNQGIKVEISNTAGTFVCNHVLYGVRYMIEHEFPHKKSGFIHVPALKEQVCKETPYMNEKEIIKGLTAAIKAIDDTIEL